MVIKNYIAETKSFPGLASAIAYPAMFVYIFNITPVIAPVSSVFYVSLSVFLAMLLFSDIRSYVLRVILKSRFAIVIFTALGIYGTLLSVMWGPAELYSMQIFFKGLTVIVTSAGFVAILCKNEWLMNFSEKNSASVVRTVFELFFRVCLIQAIIIIIEFLFSGVRDSISGILVSRGNIDEDHPFRFRGLHDSGGFSLTATMGFAATYGIFTCVSKCSFSIIKRLISTTIIIISIAFIGRTGFIVFAIGIAFLFIKWSKSILHYLFIMTLITASVVAFFYVFFPDRFEFFEDFVFGYAFEFFVNYSDTGKLSTASSDDLATMLFIPDWFNIIFGSGSFDEPNAGVDRSDSGYMKTMLSLGLAGIILVYGLFIYLTISAVRSIKFDADIKYFMIVLFILMFFVEIKSPIFYQNDMSRLFWLVFSSAVVPWVDSKMPKSNLQLLTS
jgi:hypothetical protein